MKWPVFGLAVVVVANLAMLATALANRPTMETEDYYADAIAYDSTLAERSASAALGWRGHAALGADLAYAVVDAEGKPVTGLEGTISVRRSDTDSADASHAAVETAPGRYAVTAPMRAGLYRVDVRLARGSERWVDQQQVAR